MGHHPKFKDFQETLVTSTTQPPHPHPHSGSPPHMCWQMREGAAHTNLPTVVPLKPWGHTTHPHPPQAELTSWGVGGKDFCPRSSGLL